MNGTSEPKPSAMWIGAGLSIALLVCFILLEWADSPILMLAPQWLLVALVPLMVGLIVGGYIKEFKLGDYSVGVEASRILKKSEPVADSALRFAERGKALRSITGWPEERDKEYNRTHRYMLAHVYRPSKMRGLKFEVSIFVVQHEKGTDNPPRKNLNEIEKVEFFFGESWGNQVFEAEGHDGLFAVRTHAWGTFLAACRVSLKQIPGQSIIEPFVLFRYIDFSMAEDSAWNL